MGWGGLGWVGVRRGDVGRVEMEALYIIYIILNFYNAILSKNVIL
jgi:hypothetical protein